MGGPDRQNGSPKWLCFVKNEKIENRFTNNRYEAEEIYLICKYLQSDDIVLELGASIGGTSCVINNSLTNKTNMVSVEANPDVMYVLENNRNKIRLCLRVLTELPRLVNAKNNMSGQFCM